MSQRLKGSQQSGGGHLLLLSNIMLDEYGEELESGGHSLVCYADDCNIYEKSKAAAKRVLGSVS